MLDKIKTVALTIVSWLLTFLYFGVFVPIMVAVVGLLMPIDIIWMSIQEKELISPLDYWVTYIDAAKYSLKTLENALVYD